MIEQALIEYLLNALWQVPLFAGGGWLLLRTVRPGPRIQHYVWLAVLGLAVLTPVRGMGRSDVLTTQPQQLGVASTAQTVTVEEIPLRKRDRQTAARHWFAFSHFFPRTRSIRLSATTARWVARLYIVSILFGLTRIAQSWRGARYLVMSSRETSFCDGNRAIYEDHARKLGVKMPLLRESQEVSSPMIVRVAAPIMLLPKGFARHSEAEITAALCHEFAHIKRQDYLVNVICQVAALPLFWHPVVSGVQQRIRMTREMVCDAMAAEEMESQIGYAKCLLALAHSMLGGRAMAGQAQFTGLFGSNTLEERVNRLMEKTTTSVRVKMTRLATGMAMTIAIGSMSAMFHVTPTMAQSKPDALPQAAPIVSAISQAQSPVPEPSVLASPVTGNDEVRIVPGRRASTRRNSSSTENDSPGSAERARVEARAQAAEAKAMIDSPEFRKQIEEAQQQAFKAKEMIASPEFKRQMDHAREQAAMAKAMIDSPEFQRQIDQAREQAAKAKAMIDSPEFQRQIDQAREQAAKAKAMIDSPEFQRQIDQAREQADKSKAMIDSPEFQRQMDELKQQTDSFTWQKEQSGPQR